MEKNNQERVRSIWKPLCLLFAALLTLSWVFFGFLYSKGGVNFSTLETPEQEQSVSGGMVIGEGESNGVALMSAEISPADYSANDVSPLAETAYTLTATLSPANATNKVLDWSVEFVNPDASWARNKTVTDYVTVTPTSDGALTATVECKKAFGEQIKVIAAVRETPSVKAECLVDYMERLSSKPTFNGASFWFLPSMVNIPFPSSFTTGQTYTMGLCTKWTETRKYKPSLRDSGSVYTVKDESIHLSAWIGASAEVKSYFSSHYVTDLDLYSGSVNVTDDFTPNLYLFQKIFGSTIVNNGVSMTMLANGLNECDVDLILTIRLVGAYSTMDYEIGFNIDTSTLQMEIPGQAAYAPSVSLDETQTIL